MLSNICVATTTGVPRSRHAETIRSCAAGTSSSGISTPKSPRATMTTSADSTIAVRSSRAAGCSIFATIQVWTPAASMRSRAGIKSAALRTYETATKSTFCESAWSRQSKSCGPTAGSFTSVRGTLIPFRSVRIPPSSTRQRTISPSKSGAVRTSSRISPSESRTGSPFCRSFDSPSHSTGRVLTISPRIVVLCGGKPSA